MRKWLVPPVLYLALLGAGPLVQAPPRAVPPAAALRADEAAPKKAPRKDAPALTLPAAVQGKVGRYVYVKATTEAKNVRWFSLDPGLDVDPELELRDPNAVAVIGDAAGVYRLEAVASVDDAIARAVCNVTIGTPPGPGPTPPPGPADPFAKSVQDAWGQETDPNRVAQAQQLAALYKEAEATANDAGLMTLNDLYATLQAASAKLLPTAALPKVRAAVAAYLSAQLGTAPATPLDASLRAKAVAAFAAAAAALGGLK